MDKKDVIGKNDNPLAIDDNTAAAGEPKENKTGETDNPGEHATKADDSDSDSSSSSASSSCSIKSEDMKKMLKDMEPESHTRTTERGDAKQHASYFG